MGGFKPPSRDRGGSGRPDRARREGASSTPSAPRGGKPASSGASRSAAPPGTMRVNGHSDRWLAQGFPWVYPNEVDGPPVREVAEVTLLGPSGAARGRAITDTGWIAARVLRADGGPLDLAWMRGVIGAARRRRAGVVGGDTTGWRLIHGENDGLPGVRVDCWGRARVVILDTLSMARVVPLLVEALVEEGDVDAIWQCFRPDPRDEAAAAGARPSPTRLWAAPGQPPASAEVEIEVREDGMRMGARPFDGPDVGLYADMREVRRWLAPRWAGCRVLNTFCYTGAFSVSAALHGAAEVLSVDLSRPNLDRAIGNFVRNGLDPARYGFEAEDTFKVLDRCRRTGVRFDRVILDPPSFSHGPSGSWSARQDMPRLVAAATAVLAPGGWLLVASNQGQVAPREFRGQVAQGFARAGRSAVELCWHGAAPDYPAAVTFPEGHYLKVGVWAVD
jgi:23S rRNA (cytosine1962-C5)-methyltransferase